MGPLIGNCLLLVKKKKSLVKSVWYSTYLSSCGIFQISVTFEGMRAPGVWGIIFSKVCWALVFI